MGEYERRLRNALPGRDWGTQIAIPNEEDYPPYNYTGAFPWGHVPEHVRRGSKFLPFGSISPGVGNPVTVKHKDFVLLSYAGRYRLCILPQSPEKHDNRLTWNQSLLPPEWEFRDRETNPELCYSRMNFVTYTSQVDTAVPGGQHGFHFLMGVVSMAPEDKFPRTWVILKEDWGGTIRKSLEAYQAVETFVKEYRDSRAIRTKPMVLCPLTGSLGIYTASTEGSKQALEQWIKLGVLHQTAMNELVPFTTSTNPTKGEREKRYRLGEGSPAEKCLHLRIPLQQWEQFHDSVKVGQYCAFPYPTLGHSAFQHGDYVNACSGGDIYSPGIRGAERGVLKKIGGCYISLAQSHILTTGPTSGRSGAWPKEVCQLPQRWWDCLAQINKGMPTLKAGDPDTTTRGGTALNGLALLKVRGLPTLVVVRKARTPPGFPNPPKYGHFWLWPGSYRRNPTSWTIAWEGSNALPLRLPVEPLETQREVAV